MRQRIWINGQKGETYTFGGWAKCDGTGNVASRQFQLRVLRPTLAEGFGASDVGVTYFNMVVSGWQYQQSTFTLTEDCKYVELYMVYPSNPVYFDGLTLNLSAATDALGRRDAAFAGLAGSKAGAGLIPPQRMVILTTQTAI